VRTFGRSHVNVYVEKPENRNFTDKGHFTTSTKPLIFAPPIVRVSLEDGQQGVAKRITTLCSHATASTYRRSLSKRKGRMGQAGVCQ
jgi:hypothetical protein